MLITRLFVLFDSMRIFGIIGLSLLTLGSVYGFIIAIVNRGGLPTLAGVAILSGIQTLLMGLLADQITEQRKEKLEKDPELLSKRH